MAVGGYSFVCTTKVNCIMNANFYVSITGFVPKDLLSTVKFMYFTSRAFKSAQMAEGNISSSSFFSRRRLHDAYSMGGQGIDEEVLSRW